MLPDIYQYLLIHVLKHILNCEIQSSNEVFLLYPFL